MKIKISSQNEKAMQAVLTRLMPIIPEGTRMKKTDKHAPTRCIYITVDDDKLLKLFDG